ncbi:putative 2-dehydropantoate 2-reductase [Diplogelasinospora grovesii]|uniref:2-dehydropantoate 2-reductase n=1 Tax=Diplogelasinospora grovesii TaxID=303347 RepID=A0AAN6MZS7_9PEZI|nr:putative 2-dehydropantoate 2-reductase [Diplogelasinospora grovesii]
MLRTIRRPFGASRPSVSGRALRRFIHRPKLDDPIHVLGVGNLGKYIAHSPMKQASKPVILLFHRPSLDIEWQSAGCGIQCITDSVLDKRSGFRVEVLPPSSPSSSNESSQKGSFEPIKYLIVATKTYMTTSALELVKGRLDSKSSILFLQNGMGTMDKASAEIFPDPESRPAYWAGICSAGVYSIGPFTIVHAGRGPLKVGLMEGNSGCFMDKRDAASTQDGMIERLSQAGVLETTVLTSAEIKEAQLQKLVVNAIINPLTAIFRCQNGQLLDNPTRFALMKLLINETGPIVRALLHRPSDLFSDLNLLDLVLTVAHKTGANTSSMLQDVQVGQRTEIDYINGYVVAQGTRLGLPNTHSATIVRLVKEQQVVQDQHVAALFPIGEIL